jgi:hypothetical protein
MPKHNPLAFLDAKPKRSPLQEKVDAYMKEQEKRLGKLPKPRKPRAKKEQKP